MLCISHLCITNFRACRELSIPLGHYTPLVGPNNSGKSAILESLRWVLEPSALAVSDFHDISEPVVVAIRIEGVDQDLLDLIPDPKHRKAIAPYCRDGLLWIRCKADPPTGKGISKEVWDIDKCPTNDVPASWRSYPTGLPEAVSVLWPEPLFIEAMADIGEDLGKAKAGTTIKSLLDDIMTPLLADHQELAEALNTIHAVLSWSGPKRSPHLAAFDDNATAVLATLFPGLALDLDIQAVNIRDFFKVGDLHVRDTETADRRRFDQVGSGAQRAIQMALVRYLAQVKVAPANGFSRRLLLIDEPEMFLHPQATRRLRQALHQLSVSGFQVVFATHSPLMVSRENAPDTIVVSKTKEDGTLTRQPLRQAVESALANAKSQARVLFELGNIADIYFSRKVILCEGKTDRRLLPLAYERLCGTPPEVDGIAFVSLGSCADLPKALPVLEAMKIPAMAVADLDFAFTHARQGDHALLEAGGPDLIEARALFLKLAPHHQLSLGGNELPINSKTAGPSAAKAWSLFASHAEGHTICAAVHDDLKAKRVWVWRQGCIEDVTGHTGKGEEAISEQEERLLAMTAEEIKTELPALNDFIDWIRSPEQPF